MIKFLFIFIIFTNLSFSQSQKEPEQTKFDFPGFTLKGCLGSELSKPKRQVAKLPSKRAQNYLKQLFPLLQSDNEDLVKAKDVLNIMKSDSDLIKYHPLQ